MDSLDCLQYTSSYTDSQPSHSLFRSECPVSIHISADLYQSHGWNYLIAKSNTDVAAGHLTYQGTGLIYPISRLWPTTWRLSWSRIETGGASEQPGSLPPTHASPTPFLMLTDVIEGCVWKESSLTKSKLGINWARMVSDFPVSVFPTKLSPTLVLRAFQSLMIHPLVPLTHLHMTGSTHNRTSISQPPTPLLC